MNKKDEQEVIRRKLRILAHVEETKNVSKTCRYWGISRDTFYRWKKEYKTQEEVGLINSKPCPENPSIRVAFVIEEKILYLRKNYHFASDKICWYLERYHKMKVSMTGVYEVLCRHGLNRLTHKLRRRQIKAIKRYEKKVPRHHVQVDVKFLSFSDENSNKTRRFQYTAIDDATRIRALKVYEKHNQECAIDYINHVVEKFPFRIKIIRTDNGHEFRAKFHWHCEDLGLQHVYIKPASPNLNDKVERSHLSDKQEFYQVTFCKKRYDSLEMLAKDLDHWRDYYNNERTYQGKMCCGRTPMNTLTNGKRIWAEKNLTQI